MTEPAVTDKLYDNASYAASALITKRYSTSFTLGIRLFQAEMRPHIYGIYGLVRLADEIVDSWHVPNAAAVLTDLEQQVSRALIDGYSTNPIIHAYVLTACKYRLDPALLHAFFDSMRLDLSPQHYDDLSLQIYIYGSAEVVGLMCLAVFTAGDIDEYSQLAPGARALGSAFQKVNFLRDLAADHALGRWYLPYGTFDDFDEAAKAEALASITDDFAMARPAIIRLPTSVRRGVMLADAYYEDLTRRLTATPVATLKTRRVRVPSTQKAWLLARQLARQSRS